MKATRGTYGGLFLVTLATLMYEILLTRIFSVTMWYHFAFMAISIAMFGMTAGALLVYLFENFFRHEKTKKRMTLFSLLFAVSMVGSFLAHLNIRVSTPESFSDFYPIVLTYVVVSVPFVFSGICVCLALTRFPHQVSRLYAVDLAGAAAGCILLIYMLRITDAPTAVFLVAFCAAAGAFSFSLGEPRRELMVSSIATALVLASISVWHTDLIKKESPLLRVKWSKKGQLRKPLYEKWNSFSRVTVMGDSIVLEKPFGWGLSSVYPQDRRVRQLRLNIDAGAETILTRFSGDWSKLEHLKYDVTNLAHYIRPHSRVLVVGAGGGRDVLSALTFEQESVLAVEINEDILEAVNGKFGDFTGHLDRNPKVTFVNDEARSFISRQRDRFDIIQVSLIDTWAATAAGALVLTENSLYTLEAWKLFLERLTPRGVLSFSRWYTGDPPSEFYRLVLLASTSLLRSGVENPRDHIVIVKKPDSTQKNGRILRGVGTILVSRGPFSEGDLKALREVAQKLGFELVLSPHVVTDPAYVFLTSEKDWEEFVAAFPHNIEPPSDNRPFFFYLSRVGDFFSVKTWTEEIGNHKLAAVRVLGVVFFTVLLLTGLTILLPLLLKSRQTPLREASPLLLFFAAIGWGFMLVEISQMQRLIVFLGHPTYGLSVVLFSLLLAGGVGSYLTRTVDPFDQKRGGKRQLYLLLGVLILFGVFTSPLIRGFESSQTPVRIFVAAAILLPLGVVMGMAFPLGMKVASRYSAALTPWLWGINGATSVCASVMAIAIALSWGISASYWTGCFFYLLALGAFVWATRRRPEAQNIPNPAALG